MKNGRLKNTNGQKVDDPPIVIANGGWGIGNFNQTGALHEQQQVVVPIPVAFTCDHIVAPDGYGVGVPVAGTGLRPVMAAPDTVDFGGGGGSEVTRTISLVNQTLTDTISVAKVSVTGPGAAYYKLEGLSFPHLIPGGASWDLTVTYTPPIEGSTPPATLTVSSSVGKTRTISLRAGEVASGIGEEGPSLGLTELSGATPNPFASTTTIRYQIAGEREHITVDVLDLLGRRVALIGEGTESRGEHTMLFDGAALPAGSYLCRMTVSGPSGGRTLTRPLVLVR